MNVSWGEVRQGHTWTCWRDSLDPHLGDLLNAGVELMERHQVELDAPGFGRAGTVIRYGHWGRPVLVFPSEQGRAWDYENNGMVGAVADLIDGGRCKLYCVDSFDEQTWSDSSIPLEERARRHGAYAELDHRPRRPVGRRGQPRRQPARWSPAARWAPTTRSSSRSPAPTCSRSRICQSGNYDPADWNAWGDRGEAAYFTNPSDYVAHLHGDHLDWLRQQLYVVLVVGEGPWETHPTGSLPSARHLGGLLAEKGIPHELDVWGHDSAHDWDWWAEADRAPPAAVRLTR